MAQRKFSYIILKHRSKNQKMKRPKLVLIKNSKLYFFLAVEKSKFLFNTTYCIESYSISIWYTMKIFYRQHVFFQINQIVFLIPHLIPHFLLIPKGTLL